MRWEKANIFSSRCSNVFFLFSSRIHELYLPKFSIKSNYELNDILFQLGIKKIFTDAADLSGVTGTRNLVVSQVSLYSVDSSSSYQSVKCGSQTDGRSPGICKIIAFPATQSSSLGLPKPRRAGLQSW